MTKEEQNKLIAKKVIPYLKKRMMLNQEILKDEYDVQTHEPKPLIKFNDYINERIMLDEFRDKIHKSSEFIRKDLNEMLDNIYEKRNEVIFDYAPYVIIDESEIDNLMNLIKLGIEKYGIEKGAYSENTFIELILTSCKEDLEIYNKYSDDINKWIFFFDINESIGFEPSLGGTILSRNNIPLIISNNVNDIMCFIENDEVVERIELDKEDIYLNKNMYVGYLFDNTGEPIFTIFLEKNINGKKMYKSILTDNNFYSEKMCDNDEQYVTITSNLASFLETQDCNGLNKDVYKIYELKYDLAYIVNKYFALSDEEKKKINEPIEAATNYWVDIIKEKNPSIDDKRINIFRGAFSSILRMNLVKDDVVDTEDYTEHGIVRIARKKAKIRLNQMLEPIVRVSSDKVVVKSNIFEADKIIYTNSKKLIKI